MPTQKRKGDYTISVTGLGYVGLPLALAFSKKYPVIGFDKSIQRIKSLSKGIDQTKEIPSQALKSNHILFTSDFNFLKQANIHIIAVPTPVDNAKKPDFSLLVNASKEVGSQLKNGDIVIYESTVYPGATEEICLPILEKVSKLKCPRDFSIAYSPERINPGDKVHTFEKVTKVVSGYDKATCNKVAKLYSTVVKAGVHKVSSIKVAEAAKVIENTQRDLNVALMNELALIFDYLHIDTLEVIEAAATKWNFLPFHPGLVGGHCIGVDPYYLTYKAEQLHYHPQVILSGRRINDDMSKFIVEKVVKKLIQNNIPIKDSKVAVLGLTFKENCTDIRNSKVFDVIEELESYGVKVVAHDPEVNPDDIFTAHHFKPTNWLEYKDYIAILICVGHDSYRELPPEEYTKRLVKNGVLFDVKGILNKNKIGSKVDYCRL